MPGKHAFLSASAADRWGNCPGSAHLATLFPESHSLAAEEGTLAHELAELSISEQDLGDLPERVDKFYKDHTELPGDFKVMENIIAPYVNFVRAEYIATKNKDEAAVLSTEERVDFSEYVPDGFGTSDVVIVGDDMIEVIDLKYGKGVPVSAIGNPQIRLYALGAIAAYDLVYDFSKVKMVIYQPRLDSVTEETMTVEELKAWAQEFIVPAAQEAMSDTPSYHAGEWCQSHFCPAAGSCRTRAEYFLALERHSGKEPGLLTDEELADCLTRIDALGDFAKRLGEYCLNEALSGHKIPGWKIVEGRSVRKYTDEDQVAAKLKAEGYDEALLYERSLLGITKMEGMLGKKAFKQILEGAGLVHKPAGAPKLAPDADKRPEYSQAKADFED